MCVRTSMLNYLKSLSKKMSFDNGLLVYSFWNGYKEQKNMQVFLEECKAMGLKMVTLHTTGRANQNAIQELIEKVQS